MPFPGGMQPIGGAVLPAISFASGALNAATGSGSQAGQASATGSYAGSWSLNTSAPLVINGSTGALTTTGGLSGGSYSATLTYTFSVGGETYTISETVSIVVAAAAPAAPNLSVTPDNAQNVLTWTDGATNGAAITAHNLYRGTAAGGESLLGQITTGSPYTDTGLTNGVTYYYRLSAVNSAGEGALSAEVSAAPVSGPSAPPTGYAYATDPYDGAYLTDPYDGAYLIVPAS